MGTSPHSIDVQVNLDEDGFLTQPEIWNRDIACFLAQDEVPGALTDDHWKIVDCLRQHYQKSHTLPPVRLLCEVTHCDVTCIYRLFPSGLSRGACKVAGIPKPNCWMFDAYGGL